MNNLIQQQNSHFRKKIPADAETSNVLIATVDFIDEPVVGLARLKKSVLLEDVTEVSVPTRFMVVIIGSVNCKNELHEIGRCISTMMADNVSSFYFKKTFNFNFFFSFTDFSRSCL